MQMHYYCLTNYIEDVDMPQLPLETESTLTERFQTTVPSVVRKALHLSKKDKIKFTVQADGNVTLSRVQQDEADPALDAFLSFLGNDIQNHPESIQPLSASMKDSAASLITDVEVDLDAPLSEDDE
jgi:antitoxin PrlF